jgi:NADPH-dependent 2,4-dienoyl-CoA reductase/sulfur reductase-like enzyme
MRLIIIGGVAAGSKAAAKARRVDPDLEIVVYQDEAEVSYSACGEPYVISGVIRDRDDIIIRQPAEFAQSGVQVYTRHRVEAIDCGGRRLDVLDLDTGKPFSTGFDRLIIATGASPIIPDIPGVHLDGVAALRSLRDMDNIRSALHNLKPRTAAIVGAGYIGLELAEALSRLGIATTIIERLPRILPAFDVEIGQQVAAHATLNGIDFVLGEGVVGLRNESGRVAGVETDSGRHIAAELVVLAMGVRPNVALARQSGIELGPTGAIKVNSRMETAVAGVYAAGDCCETINRITGAAAWVPLGDLANLQGRVAGENAAGGDACFPGSFGTAIFKTFDFNVAITGLSETAARAAGFEPLAAEIKALDKARYYPGARPVTLKLVADACNGRLLGAQAVGRGAADKMIDIAATALLGRLSCEDLENADFAYSPPFSPVLSPIIVAAGTLNAKLKSRSGSMR